MKFKPVQSIQRAVAMIEAVGKSNVGLCLKELAQVIETSPPAAYNMAQTLVAEGYLERRENPIRYHLGESLLALTSSKRRTLFEDALDRAMLCLADELPGASVYYCEAQGSEVMVKAIAAPPSIKRVQRERSYPLPAYTSLGSMVHLAFWTENHARRYREAHPFEIHGAMQWSTEDELQTVLERIREDGVFFYPMKDPDHLRAGIPILTPSGSLHGSLTIAMSCSPETIEELKNSIQSATAEVCEGLSQTLS